MNPRAVHTAYYIAHGAKSLLWTASDLVTIYALVSLYGVEPRMAGWLFLTGLGANALADFAVGAWLARHPEGTPRLAGAGLTLAVMTFPFTVLAAPLGLPALAAATLVFRVGYAAYDVPHNAVLSWLADTPGAATRLSRGRTLGTGAAAGLVGYGLWQVGGGPDLPGLLWTLAGVAALGGMTLIPLLAGQPTAVAADHRAAATGLPRRFLLASLIGIVALGAMGKAQLHVPVDVVHPDAGITIVLLTVGRTAAALLPLAFAEAQRGIWTLAAVYAAAVPAVPALLWAGGWAVPLLLGLLLGATNLVSWAVLPLLARGPRSYGLYTMASKLALGLAGVAMTAMLGDRPTFVPGGLVWLTGGTIAACALAAVLLALPARLTPARVDGRRGA